MGTFINRMKWYSLCEEAWACLDTEGQDSEKRGMLKTHEWVTTEGGPQEHMLEASPGEGKGGQASSLIRAQFIKGSLCPSQHAENFTRILSFPTSDRLCHVLTFQRKNPKVKKVK